MHHGISMARGIQQETGQRNGGNTRLNRTQGGNTRLSRTQGGNIRLSRTALKHNDKQSRGIEWESSMPAEYSRRQDKETAGIPA